MPRYESWPIGPESNSVLIIICVCYSYTFESMSTHAGLSWILNNSAKIDKKTDDISCYRRAWRMDELDMLKDGIDEEHRPCNASGPEWW